MSGDLRNPPPGMTDHDLLVAVFYDVRDIKDAGFGGRISAIEDVIERAKGAAALLFIVPTLIAVAAFVRG